MNAVDHERVATWDAAYVLGALTSTDRRMFEEHMRHCPACRDAVNDLASMPGLLARLNPAPDVHVDVRPDEPADLLGVAIERERRRRSRRQRTWWAASAAAVLALAVGLSVAVLPRSVDDAVTIALEPVASRSPSMSVEVTLTPTAWGTRLAIECEYPTRPGYGGQPRRYVLVGTDTDGATTPVSSWQAVPGATVTLDAATAMDVEEMTSLTVLTATGDELLTAPVPRR